jgi:hypothetical protein
MKIAVSNHDDETLPIEEELTNIGIEYSKVEDLMDEGIDVLLLHCHQLERGEYRRMESPFPANMKNNSIVLFVSSVGITESSQPVTIGDANSGRIHIFNIHRCFSRESNTFLSPFEWDKLIHWASAAVGKNICEIEDLADETVRRLILPKSALNSKLIAVSALCVGYLAASRRPAKSDVLAMKFWNMIPSSRRKPAARNASSVRKAEWWRRALLPMSGTMNSDQIGEAIERFIQDLPQETPEILRWLFSEDHDEADHARVATLLKACL